MDGPCPRVGKPITLEFPCPGMPPGGKVNVKVFEPTGLGQAPVDTFDATVDDQGGLARATWTYDKEKLKDKVDSALLIFVAEGAGRTTASRPVQFVETLEATIEDKEGNPAANRLVLLHANRGADIEAATNSKGELKVDVPPGEYHIEVLGAAPPGAANQTPEPAAGEDSALAGAGAAGAATGAGFEGFEGAEEDANNHWAVVLGWNDPDSVIESVHLASNDGKYEQKITRAQAKKTPDSLHFFFPEGHEGIYTISILGPSFSHVRAGVPLPARKVEDAADAPDDAAPAGDGNLVCEVCPAPPNTAGTVRARLTGLHFDTNKTFVLPSAMTGIRELVRLYHDRSSLQVLVTGHTDSVGQAEYNRGLSAERAESVKRFLQDDVDGWLEWYSGNPHSKAWGVREDQLMLATLTDPSTNGRFYTGAANGTTDAATKSAYKAFQNAKGLPATGSPDKATRSALVTDYMALEGTSLGKDVAIETHGCGPFHQAVQTPAGTGEPENRRVEVFLFEKEVDPAPQKVCPSPGCKEYAIWVGKTTLTVDLDKPPGDLVIKVQSPDGVAVRKAVVKVSSASVSDQQETPDVNPDQPNAGTVEFKNLPPDDYTVTVQVDGISAQSTVTVASPEPDQKTSSSSADAGGSSKAKGSPASQGQGDSTVVKVVRDRAFYIRQSLTKAFGSTNTTDWDPALGYQANRPRIVRLYEYYKNTYNHDTVAFVWAGLGRMAGGAVVAGLDFATSGLLGNASVDKGTIGQTMVKIGKDIFFDLAWQLEAFSDTGTADGVDLVQNAFALVRQRDKETFNGKPPIRPYEKAWQKILDGVHGNPDDIASGNLDLLMNEQWIIIQPSYDRIRNDPDPSVPATFASTRAFTRNIHPYHRDFLTEMPGGTDVTLAPDRWQWITGSAHSMFPVWGERHPGQYGKLDAMPLDERTRLVNLPFDAILKQQWGSVIQDLLPPGSP